MNPQAKTAVVTGANSGIGLALTKKLLAEGYRVIGTARSGQLEDLSDASLMVIPLDVTDEASVEQAVARIGQLAEGVDLLANNAGINPDVMSVTPDRKAFTDTFATNVDGTVVFMKPMLHLLKFTFAQALYGISKAILSCKRFIRYGTQLERANTHGKFFIVALPRPPDSGQ